MNILIVEDCLDTKLLIKSALGGFNLTNCETIEQAKAAIKEETPDLILLDIELPDGSGFDLCQELSQNPILQDTPIIILSSKSEVSEKVMGLHSGADDYMTKPFSTHELKARVETKLRKKSNSKAGNFETNQYLFDFGFQKAVCKESNDDLNLTPTEFRILYSLAQKPNTAFSRRDLVKAVWSDGGLNIETKGLDAHISHLRKKLGIHSKRIVSIYGKGYSFDPGASIEAAA